MDEKCGKEGVEILKMAREGCELRAARRGEASAPSGHPGVSGEERRGAARSTSGDAKWQARSAGAHIICCCCSCARPSSPLHLLNCCAWCAPQCSAGDIVEGVDFPLAGRHTSSGRGAAVILDSIQARTFTRIVVVGFLLIILRVCFVCVFLYKSLSLSPVAGEETC